MGFEYQGKTERHESQKGQRRCFIFIFLIVFLKTLDIFSFFHALVLSKKSYP